MKKAKKAIIAIALSLALSLVAFSFTGCASVFNPEGRIIVAQRQEGSGARSAFLEGIFGGSSYQDMGPQDWTPYNRQESTANVYAFVSGIGNAIGYDSLGHLRGREGVKMLSVDGVIPSLETVRDGSYRMQRPLIIAYNEDMPTNAREFFRFLHSTNAFQIIEDEGYIAPERETVDFVVTPDLTGVVTVMGSTSVMPLMEILAESFMAFDGINITVTVSGGGSGAGRNAVRDGNTYIGMTSAAVTQSQLVDMNSNGREVNYTHVAFDAIVVVVNNTNVLYDISFQQLVNIFARRFPESDRLANNPVVINHEHYTRWDRIVRSY